MKIGFKNWLTQAERIKKDCQPFLQMTGMPLYRGVSVNFTELIVCAKVETVRKNRHPRDSSPFAHRLVDDWFYEKFGIRPRSQAVFCSSSRSVAKAYGTVCYMFPVGEFKFIWGTLNEHNFILRDTRVLTRQIEDAMHTRKAEKAKETTDEVMCQVTWHTANFQEAQALGAEISIFCDEVILVPEKRVPSYNKFIQNL